MRRTDTKFGVGLLCTYDVVVTYVLAKDNWRVRVPLGAHLDGSANVLFAFRSTVFQVRVLSWALAQLAQLAEHVISPSSFMVL